MTRNLVSQVQPKSGCLRGLNTNEPKNWPTVNLLRGLLVEATVLQDEDEQHREHRGDGCRHDEAGEVVRQEVHQERAREDAEGRGQADDARHLAAAADRHLVGQRRVRRGEDRVHRGLHEAPRDEDDPHRVGDADERETAEPDERAAEDPGPAHAEARRRAVRESAGERVRDEGEQRADTHDQAELRGGLFGRRGDVLHLERHRHEHRREQGEIDAEVHGGKAGCVAARCLVGRGAGGLEAGRAGGRDRRGGRQLCHRSPFSGAARVGSDARQCTTIHES